MKDLKPTEKELEILQILWEEGESSVREVHEKLYPQGEAGYTSTLKLMQIMHEKDYVSRKKVGKTHRYISRVERSEAQNQMLKKLGSTIFKGSAAKLVMGLLGNGSTTVEERKRIRQLIDEMENQKD